MVKFVKNIKEALFLFIHWPPLISTTILSKLKIFKQKKEIYNLYQKKKKKVKYKVAK